MKELKIGLADQLCYAFIWSKTQNLAWKLAIQIHHTLGRLKS